MSSSDVIVPLISTSSKGPAGIMHLPRLWQKLLLASKGRLAPDYRCGSGGFDERLFEHFGIDGAAFIAFVEREQPDYLSAERYFLTHARMVTPEKVAAFNTHVAKAEFSDPERSAMFRERVGLAHESETHVIMLNDLDDWFGFHASFTSART